MPLEAAGQPTTCRFCGTTMVPRARAAAEGAAEEAGPHCPRCSTGLVDVRSGARVVAVCERCGGVWVDRDTADYLSRVDDPDLETAVRRALRASSPLPSSRRAASVFCPTCEKQMVREELAGSTERLDRCAEHGVWFDQDELEAYAGGQRGDVGGAAGGNGPPPQKGFFARLFGARGA